MTKMRTTKETTLQRAMRIAEERGHDTFQPALVQVSRLRKVLKDFKIRIVKSRSAKGALYLAFDTDTGRPVRGEIACLMLVPAYYNPFIRRLAKELLTA